MKVTTKTDIKEFPLLNRGKVRDIYDIDDSTLLIVTTDRMSAFDVIMNEPVPYKGVILNQITLFWMKKFAHLVKNHLIESDVDKFPAALAPYREELEGRSVLVKKAKPLPVECIVRGYITGSGWKDYKATGSVCGYKLPEGLLESARLEQPLFTPSTKAELGEHDENISTARAAEILGKDIAGQIENIALALAVCEHLGVDRQTALSGMAHFKRDPYALTVHRMGEGLFVNGLSINDVQSTCTVWRDLKDKLGCRRLILLVNNRSDRGSRTQDMLSVCCELTPDTVWLMGASQGFMARSLAKKLPGTPVERFARPELLPLDGLAPGEVVFAVGNIAQGGRDIMVRVRQEGTLYVQ